MILLVTASKRAPDCANALHQATGEPVTIAQNFSEAVMQLRTAAFSVAIFDRNLVEAEPLESATAWAHLETAIVLEINLAFTRLDRMIGEVQSARKRDERNQAAARLIATHSLQGELNQTLTALLLDCDLAAQMVGLPSAACERLASIRGHAERLREEVTSQLGT
jgi:hypothetical protein